MIDKLKDLNEKYWQNDGYGSGEETFVFTDRKSKLILSAPHAVKTHLNGQVKPVDLYTGALAEYLGRECVLSTLIRTAYRDREYLADEFVKEWNLTNFFFLDLHGMVNHEDFDIAAGTGLFEADAYQKALDIIREQAEKYGMQPAVNPPHYSGIAGMKAFAARMQMLTGKPQVLQLELGSDYRNFYANPEKVRQQTIPFLKAVLQELMSKL